MKRALLAILLGVSCGLFLGITSASTPDVSMPTAPAPPPIPVNAAEDRQPPPDESNVPDSEKRIPPGLSSLVASHRSWRHGQGAIDRPAGVQSVAQRFSIKAGYSTPLGKRVRLAIVGESPIVSDVVHLFSVGSPTAIAGFVVPIVVDAVDRHSVWAAAHVGEKVRVTTPAVADANPSTAVVLVLRVVRAATAVQHLLPDSIFSRTFLPLAVDVFSGLAVNEKVVRHQQIVSQSPLVDESTLPDSEKRIPQNHYCKRSDVTITKNETSAHPCDCAFSCTTDSDGNIVEHESPDCKAFCHVNGRRCTCHPEEPCPKEGAHGNALMDMDGTVVAEKVKR